MYDLKTPSIKILINNEKPNQLYRNVISLSNKMFFLQHHISVNNYLKIFRINDRNKTLPFLNKHVYKKKNRIFFFFF